jgi:hypothetical protein
MIVFKRFVPLMYLDRSECICVCFFLCLYIGPGGPSHLPSASCLYINNRWECYVQTSEKPLKWLKYITVLVNRSCVELLYAAHDASFLLQVPSKYLSAIL